METSHSHPLTPKREVKLDSDQVKITNMNTKEVLTYDLPDSAFETEINAKRSHFYKKISTLF